MDSIKFRSVHLMDDGDGHHNFGIDGDGDGHHFKGDGRHVWFHSKSFCHILKPLFAHKYSVILFCIFIRRRKLMYHY